MSKSGKAKSDYKIISISTVVYGSMMIYYTLLPRIIIICLSLAFTFLVFYKAKKDYNTMEALFITSIATLPTSFVSILATNYGSLPLTWHNVMIIAMIVYIALNGGFSKSYFLSFLLFMFFAIIRSIIMPNIFDALKQVLTICLFLCSFLIGSDLQKRNSNDNLLKLGSDVYIASTLSVAFQILFQRIFINKTGLIIGHYIVMGQSREAYAGLMSDYSFATLYLATGILFVFMLFAEIHQINMIVFIITEIALLFPMIIVSSRTGLATLVIVFAMYFVLNLTKMNLKKISIYIASLIALPMLVSKLMANRSGQSVLDSSGRLENFSQALNVFNDNLFFGIGFGLGNIYSLEQLQVPHNFFIQYLAQAGIIGTTLILIPFLLFINNFMVKQRTMYGWLFILVAIGSMFIPDIVSSRFYFAIIIIIMISCRRSDKYETKES